MAHETIHDHTVRYEGDKDTVISAISYLENHLSRDEADVYFHQAKERGRAEFQDHYGKNFTLEYHSSEGVYEIVRR